MINYQKKLDEFIFNDIEKLKNLTILEFGVRKGISTSIFLEICKKNSGRLYSNDVDDSGSSRATG